MGWYEVKDDTNVLWVFFEDMKRDLAGEVKRVADFMQISGPDRDRLIGEAVDKADFKWMSLPENKSHFDDHFVFDCTKAAMGLHDAQIGVTKVRSTGGKVGARKEIPAEIRERLKQKWADVIQKRIHFADYDAFRASFH